MSNLDMSFVEPVFIPIDNLKTELCDEVEPGLSMGSIIAEPGMHRDVPTPSVLELTPSAARGAFWPRRLR